MGTTRRAPALHRSNRNPFEQGATHALPRPLLGGAVVLASRESRPGAKSCLALLLLRALARLDPRWGAPADESGLTLSKGPLGEPRLFLGGNQGPSLSFSHGGEQLWAAMCSEGRVGIDVAYPEEFANDYPLARAFRPEELDWAGALCPNDTARAAALIWSAKEAAVKATGAGFNLFDPLDVRVGNPCFRGPGILLEVVADRAMPAWARTEDRGWLSVALA
jgi:hypothetical protein